MHGWGGDKNFFDVFKPTFEKDFKMISFSLHSVEDDFDRPLYLEDYAKSVVEILHKEGFEKSIFIVHSFGARVVAKVNFLKNSLIEKIVFLNPAGIKPRFSIKKFLKIKWFKICKKLKIKTKLKGSEDYKILSPKMQKTFINIISEQIEPLFAQIVAPSVIISGICDKSTPPYMMKKLYKLIKNSKLFLLKNCGHFCFLDCFDKTNLLAQFFVYC